MHSHPVISWLRFQYINSAIAVHLKIDTVECYSETSRKWSAKFPTSGNAISMIHKDLILLIESEASASKCRFTSPALKDKTFQLHN